MKKINKLLSGVIIIMMIISSTGIVFAEEENCTEFQRKSSGCFAEENSISLTSYKSADKLTPKGAVKEYGTLNATSYLNSNTELESWHIDTLSPGNLAIVYIKAKTTGFMYVDALAESSSDTDSYSVYTYTDYDDAVNGVNHKEWHYLKPGEAVWGKNGLDVIAGNTYYIVIKNESYNMDTPKITIVPYVVSSLADRNLEQGESKWTLASGKNDQDEVSTTYFKVKPNKTGVMTVSLNEFDSDYYSTGMVTLLNSKKKAISNELYYNEQYAASKVYFGVKKKTTYYLKVTNCQGSYDIDHGLYGLKYTITGRVDRAIGTKKNAKKLVRKAAPTNTLFVASEGTSSDWYRFYVNDKRKTVIRINAEGIKSGSITTYIYYGNKLLKKSVVCANEVKDFTIINGNSKGKAKRGTYYVKLMKGDKTSGKYIIRYLQ